MVVVREFSRVGLLGDSIAVVDCPLLSRAKLLNYVHAGTPLTWRQAGQPTQLVLRDDVFVGNAAATGNGKIGSAHNKGDERRTHGFQLTTTCAVRAIEF